MLCICTWLPRVFFYCFSAASSQFFLSLPEACIATDARRNMPLHSQYLKRLAFQILTPSFLQSYTSSTRGDAKTSTDTPRRSTAFLDGCRGWAALFVVFGHFCNVYFSSVRFGYGVKLEQCKSHPASHAIDNAPFDSSHFTQLPFVRLVTHGDAMVNIFFIVSGYSLSIRPLKLIRGGAKAQAKLLQVLASSVLRRPIRLILPCFISTLMIALACNMGFYNYPHSHVGDIADAKGVQNAFFSHFHGWIDERPPPASPVFATQIRHWWHDFSSQMSFFGARLWSHYDSHIWTIPIEYKCSLVLFMTLAGTALLTSRNRLVLLTILSVGSIQWAGDWMLACFWLGMLLCEIDMIREANGASGGEKRRSASVLWWSVAIFALYLLSYPEVCPETTPWTAWLARLTTWIAGERARVMTTIGSTLFIAAVPRVPFLLDFFSNSLSSYLGRISYAIYLMHGPLWRSLGYSITIRLEGEPGSQTVAGYRQAVAISFLITFSVVIYVSDLFCRQVDEPIVRLARWVENAVIQKESDVVEHKQPLLPVAEAPRVE